MNVIKAGLINLASMVTGRLPNANAATMAQSTIKGRAVSAGTGDPTDLTGTQATAILDAVVGDSGSGGTKGLVPAPAAGDASAGKFLKADGTWTAPSGGGGLVLLETHTASASATLDFTSLSSTYDDYLFLIDNVAPATDNVSFQVQFGTGAGPTWDTGSNYTFAAEASNQAGASAQPGISNNTAINLFDNAGNATGENGSGSFSVQNANSTAQKKSTWALGMVAFTGNFSQQHGGYWHKGTTALSGVRFLMSSGNIASGTVRLYGIAKS